MNPFIRKFLLRAFIGLGIIIVLVALLVAEENFRGKSAWEARRSEVLAQGIKLDLMTFAPPLVPGPEDQNFAMTPLLKPLFGGDADYKDRLNERLKLKPALKGQTTPSLGIWATGKRINLVEWGEYLGNPDVLEALRKFDPELAEIAQASRRPYARFPLRYEDGHAMAVPHLLPLLSLSKIFRLRAEGELGQGQADRALADMETVFRLAEIAGKDPFLIDELVRVAVLNIGIGGVWEGLAEHRWSEKQLQVFQRDLEKIDGLGGAFRALQSERAFFNTTLQKVIGNRKELRAVLSMVAEKESVSGYYLMYFFKGWIYQNMVSGDRFYSERVLPIFDLEKRRIYPERAKIAEDELAALKKGVHPYHLFEASSLPTVMNCCVRLMSIQTAIDQAAVACALERYWLEHGEYPEVLSALMPQYISRSPHDIINGEPLRYRRTSDGRFILYSVGWNETDEQGEIELKKSGSQDFRQGDWAWRYPAP